MGTQQSTTKRILVLGLDSAGKTSLVQTIIQEPLDNQHHTQGLKINLTEREGIPLAFWELPGLPHFRPQWQGYFDGVDMLIFVVDGANPKRLLEANLTLKTVLHSPVLTGVPLLVFANKCDRINKRPPQQIVSMMKLNDIRDRHWYIQACSATTGEGIDAGLEWLLTELKKGKLAANARAVTTREVSKRHRDMLAEMVAAYKGAEPLTLRDIQLRFEKLSGVLYAASSLLVALEERGIPWKQVDMSDDAAVQQRQVLRQQKQQALREQILLSKPELALIRAAEENGLIEQKVKDANAAAASAAGAAGGANTAELAKDAAW
jgi:ADP-ribosylation factor-like protein 3